ncbi:hypothetical protein HNR23_005016 [Nocardiopsis mwathae]|uniref:Uncharacterized protein n=1 Tax=Nocardiopsis mwathae TaxID=1472723 RepID=A0A7W9YPQ2_9ACTN|nr:hypothetical protein [Nocardiopsis mwathae]MBB6174956.1 hypothetical protein [Nocardiopsis mwathae]
MSHEETTAIERAMSAYLAAGAILTGPDGASWAREFRIDVHPHGATLTAVMCANDLDQGGKATEFLALSLLRAALPEWRLVFVDGMPTNTT